jgi:hypothetical protein
VSIPVELSALVERVDEYGPIAYLITVGGDAVPHVVSVTVTWDRADATEIVVGAGRHTSSNVAANARVTLLWPPGTGGTYGLIVDGQARLVEVGGEAKLAIAPTAAVLHRTPAGDPDAPSCITVLSRAEV